MSYMLPSGVSIYPTTKWRMGAYRRVAPLATLPQYRMGAYRRVAPLATLPQYRMGAYLRVSRLGGLGQDLTLPNQNLTATEVLSFPPEPEIPNLPAVSPDVSAQVNAAVASITPTAPPVGQPQGPQPITSPVNYTTSPMTLDPLNFISPQSAIAAGANSAQTYSAWTKAVASFPNQQAAIAAGIPAGVVTQLWSASRQLPAMSAPSASWLDGTTFGIKNLYLLVGVGGMALLAASGGKRRR